MSGKKSVSFSSDTEDKSESQQQSLARRLRKMSKPSYQIDLVDAYLNPEGEHRTSDTRTLRLGLLEVRVAVRQIGQKFKLAVLDHQEHARNFWIQFCGE